MNETTLPRRFFIIITAKPKTIVTLGVRIDDERLYVAGGGLGILIKRGRFH